MGLKWIKYHRLVYNKLIELKFENSRSRNTRPASLRTPHPVDDLTCALCAQGVSTYFCTHAWSDSVRRYILYVCTYLYTKRDRETERERERERERMRGYGRRSKEEEREREKETEGRKHLDKTRERARVEWSAINWVSGDSIVLCLPRSLLSLSLLSLRLSSSLATRSEPSHDSTSSADATRWMQAGRGMREEKRKRWRHGTIAFNR